MITQIQNFLQMFLELPFLLVDRFYYVLQTFIVDFDAKLFNIDVYAFEISLYNLTVLVFSALFSWFVFKAVLKFIKKIFSLFRGF